MLPFPTENHNWTFEKRGHSWPPSFDGCVLSWTDHIGTSVYWRSDRARPSCLIQISDLATAEIDPQRRLVFLAVAPSATDVDINHVILDQIMPRLLAHDGVFVAHGGAVALDQGAVLLIGASGTGKSTLVGAFSRQGEAIMSDDVLVLDLEGSEVRVSTPQPGLRLWPDSLGALHPDGVDTAPMADYSDKRRVVVPGKTVSGPLPLVAIVLLDGEDNDAVPVLRPMMAAETCIALVTNSFSLDPADLTQARYRMVQAAAFASKVQGWSLSHPHDYRQLDDTLALIRRTVEVL